MTPHTHVPGWGVDAVPGARPGVPFRPEQPLPSAGARVDTPRQRPQRPITRRRTLYREPRVVGTRQPPRGLSGLLRRFAYRIPEHEARHWLTLLLADRIDVLEHRLPTARGALVVGSLATGLVAARRALKRRRVLT